MLLINFDKFEQYANQQYIIAIAILGIIFFTLGWIISRLMRPSSRALHQGLHDAKKELLDELNTAKKFNADYRLFAQKEEMKEEKKEIPTKKTS